MGQRHGRYSTCVTAALRTRMQAGRHRPVPVALLQKEAEHRRVQPRAIARVVDVVSFSFVVLVLQVQYTAWREGVVAAR